MFFIMGITDGRKELNHNQMIICKECGAYGRLTVFMTYTVLSLFFIPCFKWNKHYYVQTSCCGTVYELDSETGKAIARGQETELQPEFLRKVQNGRGRYKRCGNCGFETSEDFEFCPKCGNRF